jgi:mycothiol synthase
VFRLRPSSPEDAEAVLRVLAARDVLDLGGAGLIRPLLADQWRIGGFDPAADAVVAEAEGRVVGYGALFTPGALAFVDPDHERQGIGSALLSWVEARAVARGRETHRQPVAESNASAHELLADAGYRRIRTVVKMVLALGAPRNTPAPPAGISLDVLDVDRDARALHAADRAAFADNPEYEPESYPAFYDAHLGAPELDPALSRVARRGDAVAGFALCKRPAPGIGYVDLLAVEKHERGHGLGTLLLRSAFAAFTDAGLSEACLDVASDNRRALRIYERAGMTPGDRLEVFEKPTGHRAGDEQGPPLK